MTKKEVLPRVGVVVGGIEGGISSSVEVVRSVVAAGIEGGVSSSVEMVRFVDAVRTRGEGVCVPA
jgi:hypothetical protein